jgi:hypothetical protein
VSKPNEWIGRRRTDEIITPEKQLLLDYWTDFAEFLREHDSTLKIREPRPQNWMSFPIGKSDMVLSTFAYPKGNTIGAHLYLRGSNAKIYFGLLQREADDIENIMGTKLEWNDSRKKERSIDLIKTNIDVQNRENWPEQHQWLYEKLEAFYKAFREKVKNLIYEPEDTDFVNDEVELSTK